MNPKISKEQREALQREPGKPITIEDDQAHAFYVLLPLDTYKKVQALVSGDDFDANEFMPLVHEALADDIDAPGMELYDNFDANRAKS